MATAASAERLRARPKTWGARGNDLDALRGFGSSAAYAGKAWASARNDNRLSLWPERKPKKKGQSRIPGNREKSDRQGRADRRGALS